MLKISKKVLLISASLLLVGCGNSKNADSEESIPTVNVQSNEEQLENHVKTGEDSKEESISKGFNPLTDEIKAKAQAYNYNFNPASVLIKEEAEYDYSAAELVNLTDTNAREGKHLVYYFEGVYREGYQGDYSAKYAHIYLWEDGLFYGKAESTAFKGYWFNSSLQGGKDKNNQDIEDCLTMVSDISGYEVINTTPTEGFYRKQAYIRLEFTQAIRSMTVSGFLYYPEIDIALNMGVGDDHVYRVGDEFSTSAIKVYRILKDLNFGQIFVGDNYTITVPEVMIVYGKLAAEGEYTITATYNGFTTEKTIKVEKAKEPTAE